jgi:hypothetical protein
MAGYVGSKLQARLQRRAEESALWVRDTPGACNGGRMLGCDDIEKLGWDAIFEALEHDGAFGFRLARTELVPAISHTLEKQGYRIDFWDVFSAREPDALVPAQEILADGLPKGLVNLSLGDDPEGPMVRRVQEFLVENGIAPFSGSMLLGELGPVITIAIGDKTGSVVATAHAYFPHNAHSPFRDAAWGGLVAVAESQRGKKLGRFVNAMMVEGVFTSLGAEMIYELVSSTNLPSRKMVESCGLSFDPSVVCGGAVRKARGRFTR